MAPPRPTPPATATAEDVVAALDAGLADLSDTDADPRRAVIACWVRLEQAAAAAGTPAQPGDSPTDLVARLLHEHAGQRRACWPRSPRSTARPGTPPTPSTTGCARRPAPALQRSAPS